MDKMKLAHEWALVFTQQNKDLAVAANTVSKYALDYADAMQAEADKRNKAEAAQKRKEMREMLNAPNTFVERDGQHFDDVHECEVDWRLCPSNEFTHWIQPSDGLAFWYSELNQSVAPSFGFTGSHIVERPL